MGKSTRDAALPLSKEVRAPGLHLAELLPMVRKETPMSKLLSPQRLIEIERFRFAKPIRELLNHAEALNEQVSTLKGELDATQRELAAEQSECVKQHSRADDLAEQVQSLTKESRAFEVAAERHKANWVQSKSEFGDAIKRVADERDHLIGRVKSLRTAIDEWIADQGFECGYLIYDAQKEDDKVAQTQELHKQVYIVTCSTNEGPKTLSVHKSFDTANNLALGHTRKYCGGWAKARPEDFPNHLVTYLNGFDVVSVKKERLYD